MLADCGVGGCAPRRLLQQGEAAQLVAAALEQEPAERVGGGRVAAVEGPGAGGERQRLVVVAGLRIGPGEVVEQDGVAVADAGADALIGADRAVPVAGGEPVVAARLSA